MANDEVIVKSKDVYYRGINVEELKNLDVREVAKHLTARSRRSIKRHFETIETFVKRCETAVANKKKIRTQLRDIIIVPKMVGMVIGVYNGKMYNDVHVTAEMIGHRLGEFSLTRTKVQHGEAGIGATKGSRALKK